MSSYIHPTSMTLALPKEKIEKLQAQWKELKKKNPQTAVIELPQLLGKVSFSAQVVLSRRWHQKYLQ